MLLVQHLPAEEVATAVVATVKTVDKGTKTVVVKTADGVEHSFHFVGRTVAHGAKGTAKGSKDAFEGMNEGDDASCTTRSRAPTRPLKKSTTSARTA